MTKNKLSKKKSSKIKKQSQISKKQSKKQIRKKITNNIKLENLKLSTNKLYKFNETDIKDSFKVICEQKITQLKKQKLLTLNSKELHSFCKCIEKKLTLKNIKNIKNKYFKKCINKVKQDNNKRLTKIYSSKLKKSKKNKKYKL